MDPYTIAAVAAPVVGGILGESSASKGREAAAAAAAKALQYLESIGSPPDLSREIILRHYQSQGTLTPELIKTVDLAQSQVSKIKEDQTLRNAQLETLQTLGQVSRGGLRPEDRAAYNEMRAAVQRDQEAKRQQILQSMQARGQGGSGAELLAQLQGNQAAAEQASSQADRLAAQSSQEALQALGQRAQLAGGVRSQDLTAAEMRARAEDQRNQMLWQNSMETQRANIAARNAAQQQNLANMQRISEMNTQQANTEALRQKEAERQLYLDKMNLAAAKANAVTGQANITQQAASDKAKMYSGIGSAIGQGFAAYGANKSSPAKYDTTTGKKINRYDPETGELIS